MPTARAVSLAKLEERVRCPAPRLGRLQGYRGSMRIRSLRRSTAPLTNRLERRLCQHCAAVSVDEFRTSKLCRRCRVPMGYQNENGRDGKEHARLVCSVCPTAAPPLNGGFSISWSYSGALNIRMLCLWDAGPRPGHSTLGATSSKRILLLLSVDSERGGLCLPCRHKNCIY